MIDRGRKGSAKVLQGQGVKGRVSRRLTSKDYVFVWTEEDQAKMMELVADIRMHITLQILDLRRPVIMMFDSSLWAISCAIGQLMGEAQEVSAVGSYCMAVPVTKLIDG